jgi:hypothetical protein
MKLNARTLTTWWPKQNSTEQHAVSAIAGNDNSGSLGSAWVADCGEVTDYDYLIRKWRHQRQKQSSNHYSSTLHLTHEAPS